MTMPGSCSSVTPPSPWLPGHLSQAGVVALAHPGPALLGRSESEDRMHPQLSAHGPHSHWSAAHSGRELCTSTTPPSREETIPCPWALWTTRATQEKTLIQSRQQTRAENRDALRHQGRAALPTLARSGGLDEDPRPGPPVPIPEPGDGAFRGNGCLQ